MVGVNSTIPPQSSKPQNAQIHDTQNQTKKVAVKKSKQVTVQPLSTVELTDAALMSTQTAEHLGIQSGPRQPKLQPDAVRKLLPVIESYVARDKYTRALLFIKKFRDYK